MAAAPSPEEIYERAKHEGRRRLLMPPMEQVATGFIAGVTIVFGIVSLGITTALIEPDLGSGVAKVAGALAFGIGLVFLVVGGQSGSARTSLTQWYRPSTSEIAVPVPPRGRCPRQEYHDGPGRSTAGAPFSVHVLACIGARNLAASRTGRTSADKGPDCSTPATTSSACRARG